MEVLPHDQLVIEMMAHKDLRGGIEGFEVAQPNLNKYWYKGIPWVGAKIKLTHRSIT